MLLDRGVHHASAECVDMTTDDLAPPDDELTPEELLIPFEDLLSMAEVDEMDIERAVQWWDDNASDAWKGALE